MIRFDKDDRYTLKCQVDGTDDTNINQGFIDAKKEKSLPSSPSSTTPVRCLLSSDTFTYFLQRFAVEARQQMMTQSLNQLDFSLEHQLLEASKCLVSIRLDLTSIHQEL